MADANIWDDAWGEQEEDWAGGGGLGWAPETFDTTAPGDFSLSDLILDEGYVGALAVHGAPADVALYRVEL